jgi:hypothetical protein
MKPSFEDRTRQIDGRISILRTLFESTPALINGTVAYRDRQDFSAVKKIRDQAFTHVKEAVDKIRKCGQFVFWRNAARVKGYRSDYLRRINRRSTEDNTEPVPGPFGMIRH